MNLVQYPTRPGKALFVACSGGRSLEGEDGCFPFFSFSFFFPFFVANGGEFGDEI